MKSSRSKWGVFEKRGDFDRNEQALERATVKAGNKVIGAKRPLYGDTPSPPIKGSGQRPSSSPDSYLPPPMQKGLRVLSPNPFLNRPDIYLVLCYFQNLSHLPK